MDVAAKPGGDYLEALNSAQRQAATYGQPAGDSFSAGPLLVIAGAGTGKTMTLAHRVAHLIIRGVRPERILLLTFSRRAALEMTRRVEAIVRKALHDVGRHGFLRDHCRLPWSGTFHSVANRVLRRYAHNLGLTPGFSILDRGDAADLLDVVRLELGFAETAKRFPKKDTCLAIYSRCVNASTPLADALADHWPWCAEWEQELRTVFRRYVDAKQENQALDYDDLLLYLSHLVADAELAAEIGAWFDHVLVDEYQDTNLLQANILRALKPHGKGLTVVGDDAQSIYSFRAADIENILGFAERFSPPAKIVSLEQNYRSTQTILDSANCLISESDRLYRKTLVSRSGRGGRPQLVTVEDLDAEAEFVVKAVLENRESGTALRSQAVLFRSAHHSDRLELELVRRNIPYVKYGGLKFLEAAHIKDLLSILKWADNPRNKVAGLRVLKLLPGMGPALASRCMDRMALAGHCFSALAGFSPPSALRAEWPSFVNLMQALSKAEAEGAAWQSQLGSARRWYQPHLERLYDGVDTREADLEQLEQISGRYPTRERFLSDLTLDPPAAAGDLAGDPLLDEDYLILSTVHSAKGQEWDVVFLLNFTDGNFPSEFATGKPVMIEEERRLLYVAMTRAKQSLQLIAPLRYHVTQQRRDGDRHVYGARSRFMTDALMRTMEPKFHGRTEAGHRHMSPQSDKVVEVAARLREMW